MTRSQFLALPLAALFGRKCLSAPAYGRVVPVPLEAINHSRLVYTDPRGRLPSAFRPALREAFEGVNRTRDMSKLADSATALERATRHLTDTDRRLVMQWINQNPGGKKC